MKGDFSRLRFNRTKNYTQVLQQQGRVALDSDANEQNAINEQIRGTELIDVVGPFGGPSGDAGFAVTVNGNSIQIGAGRYYVEGLLCENPAAVGYLAQPYLIDPTATDAKMLQDLQNGTASAIQVFLEVWQRLVTPLDDPCLLEPALGAADTTARLQTVWRVVASEVAASSAPGQSTPGGPVLTTVGDRATLARNVASLVTARLPVTDLPTKPVIGPRPGGGTSPSPTPAPEPSPTPAPAIGCCVSMYRPVLRRASGRMSARTAGESSGCGCEPTPAAGYRGLENQLYRVEIHQGGAESAATFKWSRENGSVVVGIVSASGTHIQLDSLGRDANLGFAPGQWVEISDDSSQFGATPNQPGQLCQIQSVTPGQLSLTVNPPLTGIDPGKHAKLRRWDQSGTAAGEQGIPLSSSWIDLENGIQVQFTAGNYTAGDYWLIPARTASGQIEWPPCGSDGAAFQAPRSIQVFRAPLACIHWNANQQFNVEDCRRFFPPLTSVPAGATSALHVTKINWTNDDIVAFDQLLATGLTVTLDQAPASRIDSSTFCLTLEAPVVSKVEPVATSQGLAPIVLRTTMPLDGQITVKDTDVTWNLPFRDAKGVISGIQLEALLVINAILLQGLNYNAFTRARIRIQGADVYTGSGSGQIFLDGQVFGKPGVRADGVTARTDLMFNSGAGAKASDFESWFFLAPTLALVSLSVQASVALTPTAPGPVSLTATLTVNYAALADTVVTLSVIPPPGMVSAITVPPNVTMPRGKSSTTFVVGVRNTGVANAAPFQIVASLTNSLGLTGTVSATINVTGFVIIT